MKFHGSVVIVEGPFRMTPSMPDIARSSAWLVHNGKDYLLILYRDLPNCGGSGRYHYEYAIAIFKHSTQRPVGFITLENSESMKGVIGMFDDGDGEREAVRHLNYGRLRDGETNGLEDWELFLDRADQLLSSRYGISDCHWVPARERPDSGSVRN